jgi:uncharacterized glyoxalase superfamily protein PhnB
MTDPFDILRISDAPVDPRPDFAASLRQTLTTELETTMTATETTSTTTQTVTAYLSVRNAVDALAFYVEAFGAVEESRLVGDDGRIGHAEILIGSTKLMLADEYPEIDVVGPQTRGGPTCSFTIEVPDVDAAYERAVASGAIIERTVADQFHGNRMGTLRDPFGHRWTLSTPIAGFERAEYAAASKTEGFELVDSHHLKHHQRGDLYYFTLPTPDLARAKEFFAAVLAWQFPDPDNGHIGNISAPPGALAGDQAVLYFVVDDINAAVVKVRELGGTAASPVLSDSGWTADCTDDQGTRFSLSVPAKKYTL